MNRMADQEAEENLNTNPANEFMGNNEIAFIISKDMGNENRVLIIGNALQESIKAISDANTNPVGKTNICKIIKFKNTDVPCDILKDGLPMDDTTYIDSIELTLNMDQILLEIKDTKYIVFPYSEANKLTFEREGDNAKKCNTSVKVSSGFYHKKANDDVAITKPTTITAKDGNIEDNAQEGAKPRRKRNKASMKKYKKRKSSTGKKKKIPRRRSRKLRRK